MKVISFEKFETFEELKASKKESSEKKLSIKRNNEFIKTIKEFTKSMKKTKS